MIYNVVHFLDSDTFGGCEEVVLALLQGLDRSRWRPILFHHDAEGISRLVNKASQLGIPCRTVPRITRGNASLAMRQFSQELRAVKPAIVHGHLNWPLGCRHGITAAWLSRVPSIVATSHLYSSISGVRFAWLKQRFQASMIDRYIAVSTEVMERLCQDLRVPATKIRVVHNGIQLAPFERPADSSLRAMLMDGNKYPIVFTPARLHAQKGHEYLLEAASMVPDAIFVLAGEGPERNSLQKRARELGIERRVRFLGFREDIPQLLASSDVFVLPSLYEGLPISVLEAMSAGKPVVATAIGGTDEAITQGESGILVPPANPAELARAIRLILSDKELAVRLGKAARVRAVQKFSLNAMAQGVSRVYEELIP